MRMFRKVKAFMLGKSEVDIISGQIYNYVLKRKLAYLSELDPFFNRITNFEKLRILESLKQKEDLKFEDDMIQYQDNESGMTVSQKNLLSALIKPEYVDTNQHFIQISSKFYQGMTCVGLPESVTEDWLSGMTRERNDVDYSIFIEPSSVQALQEYLTSELRKVKGDIYMYESRGESNPILEQKFEELTENLKNISKGSYKLYRTHIHLVSKGVTSESAIALSKKVQSSLKSFGIITKVTTNYQEQLLKSVIPTSINNIKDKGILVPDDALAASFPFSSPFYDVDEEQGMLLGWGPNNLPIARCVWNEESYSGAFMGPTGSGKSMSLKFFIDQENTIRGTKIIIIDPAATMGAEPEYKRMCEKKKGAYISFSKDSKNIPSILGLHTGDFLEDIFAIEHILSVMLGGEQGITKAQEPWLEKAILMAFEMEGITADNPASWKKVPPRLDKLQIALKKLFREAKSENARMSIEALLSRLSRFTGDGMYSFIDQAGKELSLDNPFTVFEFKNTPTQIKETLTAIVMNYVKAKAMGNRDRTLIIFEEAPLWLKHEVLADFLSTMIVLVRKSNTGMVLVLQDLGQLNNCQQGETLLGNLMFLYLMGCKKNLLRKTAMTFDLNDKEQEILLHSGIGEGIIIWNKERFHAKIKIDPETYRIITTNPNDIQMYEKEEEKLREQKIVELFKEDVGYENNVKDSIKILAKKMIDEKLKKTLLSKYPKDIQKKIKDEIDKERTKQRNLKSISLNANKLLEFWLKRGKKNILPKDGSIIVNETVRLRAERDYDITKKAEKYYHNHPPNTKPFHLTKREETLYEKAAKRLKDYLTEPKPTKKTQNQIVNDVSTNIQTKKEVKEIVKALANTELHFKKGLKNEDVKILESLGYKESKKNVFNFYGKLVTVLGKPRGNETLQHLTYKHLYKNCFSNAELEYRDAKTNMETDVMIPLANGKKIFVEIQSSPQRKNEIISKISKLEEGSDFWIIACKKNDLKSYENIKTEKGNVCSFPQSLAVVHKIINRNK
jgi:hypothetical protein